MTVEQIERIAALRRHNYPYSFIGRELGLNVNTVKSICRRKGMETVGERKTKAEKALPLLCKNCRKPLAEGARRGAMFCCDRCRIEWRRKHRRVIEKQP